MPARLDIGNRFGHVVLCADEGVLRTPAGLEGIVEGSVLVIHLSCVTSKGFGLFVVGPLEIGKKI